LHAESAVVESKALVKEVTRAMFQAARFWLNADAEPNIQSMSVTDATFQPAMFWLNAEAE
jgi:hypothetical protein